jgi:hypothetical protein
MSSVKNCDKLFSEYIRKRDCTDGYGKCITCGQIKPIEKMDCGHFMSRRFMSTRWDYRNAHAQCQKCNRFEYGNQYEHGLSIDNKYGKGAAEAIRLKTKFNVKYTKAELKEIAKELRKKINEL